MKRKHNNINNCNTTLASGLSEATQINREKYTQISKENCFTMKEIKF